MLLHHHDGEMHPAVARLQPQRVARLEVGCVAPVADLQDFQRIALGRLADMVAHERGGKICNAAAAGTGGDLAVEAEDLLRGRLDVGIAGTEIAVVQPAHAGRMPLEQARLGQDEAARTQADEPDAGIGRLAQVGLGIAVDRLLHAEEPADDGDVVETGGIGEGRGRRDLDTAGRGDEVARAGKHIPVAIDAPGAILAVAGKP